MAKSGRLTRYFTYPETSELKITAPDLSLASPCELTSGFASPVAFKDISTENSTKPDFGRIITFDAQIRILKLPRATN